MNDAFLKQLNHARALKNFGSHAEAITIYKHAIALQPNNFEGNLELGITLWQQGFFEEAHATALQLINLNPAHPNGYILLGHVSLDCNKHAESISAYRTAIELVPNRAELHTSLALALKDSGRYNEAFTEYNKALILAPDNAEIHFNRSILSLLSGDYTSGFQEYEWRKNKEEKYGNREFDKPLWLGENLEGKILLIHHEQGLGDAIQFSRYVKLLHDSGVNLIYAAHPPLVRLLSSMSEINFVDINKPNINFDFHCPLLSLPLRMGTRVETIPADIPYLGAEAGRLEKWKNRIGEHGFKIGVAWQGSGGRFAKNRLFPVSYLKPLGELVSVRLIGLHQAPLHSPWALPHDIEIENLGPDFDADADAFLDSAAAIQCCDLVISCDTAVAHLSGALGRPTWVALRHNPHWIWFMDRQDSPWYPSVRLFRQKKAGDWDGVFQEIYNELFRLINLNI